MSEEHPENPWPLPPVHRSVGRVVCLLRKARGWNQKDLAARTGLRQPNISRLESGHAEPHRETLARCAEALGVSIEELLSEERAREAELRFRAALTPRNAGQLLSGAVTPVPLYDATGPHALQVDAQGRVGGTPEMILQLPPLPGELFAWRQPEEAAAEFPAGTILIFSTQPEVRPGEYAFVVLKDWYGCRKVCAERAQPDLHFAGPDGSQRVACASVRGLWRLAAKLLVIP